MALRRAAAIASMVVALSATTASAAVLKVTVTPRTVHRNQTYTITISGRYSERLAHASSNLHTTPYLLAFIQYTGAACQRTATAEYALPIADWSWLFYPQRAQPRLQFKRVFYEQAQTRFGARRVCAYLYPTSISPQTKARPIARAGVPFREAKR